MHILGYPLCQRGLFGEFCLLISLSFVLQGASCVSDLPSQGQDPELSLPEPVPIDTTVSLLIGLQ